MNHSFRSDEPSDDPRSRGQIPKAKCTRISKGARTHIHDRAELHRITLWQSRPGGESHEKTLALRNSPERASRGAKRRRGLGACFGTRVSIQSQPTPMAHHQKD